MKTKTLGLFLTASCMLYAWTAYADDVQGSTSAAEGRMPVAAYISRTPMPAAAEPESPFSGDVRFRTNFVARGISQSQGQPSVQGEISYNSGDGVYAGLDGNSINWIDQLHPGDNVGLEADGWLGHRKHFGSDWITKVGFMRIQFPGHYVQQSPPVDQPNSTEAFGSVAWNGLSAQLNYAVTNYVNTPDSKGSIYLSVAASQPIGEYWTLGAALGRSTVAGHDPVTGKHNSRFSYTDYKLSVACDLGSGISLTLAHTWTNADLNIYTLKSYAVAGHHTWLSLEKDF